MLIDRFLGFLSALTPQLTLIGLIAISALMLVVEDRRLSLIPLLGQYILVALLISSQIYRPIVFIRMGLGAAICLMLYITAGHVQHELTILRPLLHTEPQNWPTSLTAAFRVMSLAGLGPLFRLCVMALGGLIAYGIWRTYPMPMVSTELSLTSYWLIATGLLMALISGDPLRIGFGLLTFVNGFEGIYLVLEQSLMVISLLGISDMIMALATAVCTEAWLESFKGEAAA